MISYRLVLVVSALTVLVSCKNSNREPGNETTFQNDSLTLVESSIVKYKLDSQTSPTSRSVHACKLGDSSYLTIVAPFDNSVAFFDQETGIETRKIMLNASDYPEDKVEYLGHYVINQDSIVLVNSMDNILSIANGSGKEIYRSKFKRNPATREGIYAITTNRVVYQNGKIYVTFGSQGFGFEDHTRRSTVLIHDIHTRQTKFSLNRPAEYNRGFWGIHVMDYTYVDYNTDTGRFIYSFPVCNWVVETDHDSFKKEHPASSKYFNEVNPLTREPFYSSTYEKLKDTRYDYTTSHFEKIIYDPFRKVYYRFSQLGNTREEIDDPTIGTEQRQSVIILNKDFQRLGECIVERGRYDFSNYYVSKNGLCILIKPKHYQSDDEMLYAVFQTEKINDNRKL